MSDAAPVKQSPFDKYVYYFLTVLSHILFGLQPVFSRYLQKQPAGIPTMSLLCMGFLTVLVFYIPKIVYKTYIWISAWICQGVTVKSISRAFKVLWTDFVLNWKMHLCVFSIVARYGTTFYSTGYTSAVYVQLIGLLSPFFISFLNYCFLRHSPDGKLDSLSWRTFIALLFTIIGSVLIILGGIKTNTIGQNDTYWSFLFNFDINLKKIGSDLTYRDYIGMSLAFLSTFLISVYMVTLRLCVTNKSCRSSAWLTDGENFFLFQNFATFITFIGPSLEFEDWSPWTRLTMSDWVIFFTFSILVVLVATLSSITAIQKLGAAAVGSSTSLRMVSAIVFSEIMLGESMQSAWQFLGSVIVLISVTAFLYWQRKLRQKFIMEQQFFATLMGETQKKLKKKCF